MKILRFRDWSIFAKIIGIPIILMVIMMFYYFLEFKPVIGNKLLASKKSNVKQVVNVAYGIITNYYNKSQNGELTVEQAKKEAINVIKNLRYGDNDYFWINDLQPRMIMHPMKPQLDGKDLSDVKDPNGVYLFDEMVKVVKKDGAGFVNYEWPKPGYEKPVRKVSYVKLFKNWNWVIGSGIYIQDVQKELSSFGSKVMIYLILFIFFAIILGYFIAKRISSPIKMLNTASQKLAQGNTDVNIAITSNDELGKLEMSFNEMAKDIKKHIFEINNKSKEAEKSRIEAESAKKHAETQQKYLAKNTRILVEEMENFSNGDLTIFIKPEKEDDDIAKLFFGFNKAVANLNKMTMQIIDVVQSIASASKQILISSEEMAVGSQEQSAQANEVASAIEQMTATIIETTKNAGTAADITKKSQNIAAEGGEIVDKAIEGIKRIANVSKEQAKSVGELGKSSDQISEIIQVIDEIADQTNLLALNAAIEAARAGEEGRGFAVVADEVRKLAERTTKATKQIAGMIKGIQSGTKSVVKQSDEGIAEAEKGINAAGKAAEALQKIIGTSSKVSDVVDQVATASEQQSATAEEISKNIEQISNVTSETSLGVQAIAKSAENLNNFAQQLQKLLEQFKTSQHSFNSENLFSENSSLQFS